MGKKVLALLLAGVIVAVTFSACKSSDSSKGGKDAGASTSTAVGEEKSTAKDAQGDATTTQKGTASSEKNSRSTDSDSKGETTAKKGGNTDGWKKKENGTVIKGDVRANVAKYGKATLDDGQELIEQLAESGLKGAKKLDSKKTADTVIYKYSGKRIGSDTTEYIKFEYVVQKGIGYLVTVIAANEADMDTDISYILNNLASLAK